MVKQANRSTEKKPAVKASLDDPIVVSTLCSRLASGEGILEICKDSHMPAARTVYAKMAEDEDFRTRIARAREAQQEYEADRCVEMADAATLEDWQLVKLRIWARQWRASKLAPKKYGDKPIAEPPAQPKPGDNATLPDGRRAPLMAPFRRIDNNEAARTVPDGRMDQMMRPFTRAAIGG